MTKLKIAVLMDDIFKINPSKDTSFAIMLQAQKMGWEVHYLGDQDLWLQDQQLFMRTAKVELTDSATAYCNLAKGAVQPANYFDVILIRKDPPFDETYAYCTMLLEHAQKTGVKVVNDPSALRIVNEKLFTQVFAEYCPASLISADIGVIKNFISDHQQVIAKPLNAMGGSSIFKLTKDDPNLNVGLETLTANGKNFIVVQQFIDAISETGDRRIILINGTAVEYGLARFASKGEFRSNLAVGGTGKVFKLSAGELAMANAIGAKLKVMGLSFVGLDFIGSKLTEINVTSPTCVREIEAEVSLNICGEFCKFLEQ